MTNETERSVELERQSKGRYLATNVRGGTLPIGSGEDDTFTPVELLLAAIAACSAIDVDFITSKRSEPDSFGARARGDKGKDAAQGNVMTDLEIDFDVDFPDDEDGRRAEGVLERAVRQSHDRLCTVSRTVESGTAVAPLLRGKRLR